MPAMNSLQAESGTSRKHHLAQILFRRKKLSIAGRLNPWSGKFHLILQLLDGSNTGHGGSNMRQGKYTGELGKVAVDCQFGGILMTRTTHA